MSNLTKSSAGILRQASGTARKNERKSERRPDLPGRKTDERGGEDQDEGGNLGHRAMFMRLITIHSFDAAISNASLGDPRASW